MGKHDEPDLQAAVHQLDALADLVVDRLVLRLVASLQRGDTDVGADHGTPLPDDALVHQDTARMDRKLYLRMARRQEFGSFREGQKVFAFWGDVKTALNSRMAKAPKPSAPAANPKDGLDDLRSSLGLEPKGR